MNINYHGIFLNYPVWWSIAAILFTIILLGYNKAPILLWVIAAGAALCGYEAGKITGIIYIIASLIIVIPGIRRYMFSLPVMKVLEIMKFLPVISQTEKEAADAGTIWADGELFSGKPNLKKLIKGNYPSLSEEEERFVLGPVQQLCSMTNDWEVYKNKDLPPNVWQYLKDQKFFGMIIPKAYGGLEFSAIAHSTIIQILASRSQTLAVTAMVPNSLGPGELILHHGTQEQKNYYLPRLASGQEVPCFALTEPNAGSDAGGMESTGTVFKDNDGKLKVKLNWDKRYITLAAVASLLGLAFKLYDPDKLLGKGDDLGITCALVPTNLPGVITQLRHDPMGVPFFNCPTRGKDVIIPVENIIGGIEGAGKGWRMLMECLSAGRGISLPATSTGGAKLVARVAGAYSTIRKQFGISIGKFEGITEPLARIAGLTYIMDAARIFTCGAIDSGERPSVVSAIDKYNFTESFRKIINDGMDVIGGAGISRGPKNLFAHAYMCSPVSITVEGANILTRTLMIGGNGVFRCHPYARMEADAVAEKNIKKFDKALTGHLGHIIRNFFRAGILYLTRGSLAGSPVRGCSAKYYKKISWASASLAMIVDISLITLGGKLKRMESLAGRFGDILSWMYLGTSALKRFKEDGFKKEDEPLMHWSLQFSLSNIQNAFNEIYKNMHIPFIGWFFRGPVALMSRINPLGTMPDDELTLKMANLIQTINPVRQRLTDGVYLPKTIKEQVGLIESTLEKVLNAELIVKKIKDAVRGKKLPRARDMLFLAGKARDSKIISDDEYNLLINADKSRYETIIVDEFSVEDFKNHH